MERLAIRKKEEEKKKPYELENRKLNSACTVQKAHILLSMHT